VAHSRSGAGSAEFRFRSDRRCVGCHRTTRSLAQRVDYEVLWSSGEVTATRSLLNAMNIRRPRHQTAPTRTSKHQNVLKNMAVKMEVKPMNRVFYETIERL
jgi:hypothetical protein